MTQLWMRNALEMPHFRREAKCEKVETVATVALLATSNTTFCYNNFSVEGLNIY